MVGHPRVPRRVGPNDPFCLVIGGIVVDAQTQVPERLAEDGIDGARQEPRVPEGGEDGGDQRIRHVRPGGYYGPDRRPRKRLGPAWGPVEANQE